VSLLKVLVNIRLLMMTLAEVLETVRSMRKRKTEEASGGCVVFRSIRDGTKSFSLRTKKTKKSKLKGPAARDITIQGT
jgi:hypothetical protein